MGPLELYHSTVGPPEEGWVGTSPQSPTLGRAAPETPPETPPDLGGGAPLGQPGSS